MLTPADKKFLSDKFATKADFRAVKNDLKLLATKKELTAVRVDVAILNKKLIEINTIHSRTETKIDEVLTKLDKFVGNIADLEQENKMGARTLHRHDIQIHELATATGTTISE
ncbi:MAG: hypothetical protein WCT41_03360 [Candidatus Paceibacterota bacterium]|jgi:predicted transcriptional regulator